MPIVELFSPLLLDASGDALALERLNRANRDIRFARLTWTRGTVLAHHEMWCDPFVPELVLRSVEMMMELADAMDDSLRPELGGRRFFEETEHVPAPTTGAPDGMHPALLTIVQLTYDDASLTAAEAARICGFDRDLVLTLIRDAETQELNWKDSVDDAEDAEEVEICRTEARAWEQTTALLRAALREIVLG